MAKMPNCKRCCSYLDDVCKLLYGTELFFDNKER